MNDFFCGGYESSTPGKLTSGRVNRLDEPEREKNEILPGIDLPHVLNTDLALVSKYF